MHNFAFSNEAAFPASFEKGGETVRARFPNKRGEGKIRRVSSSVLGLSACRQLGLARRREERCIATCEVEKKLCLNCRDSLTAQRPIRKK